jgi:hypothetical protein
MNGDCCDLRERPEAGAFGDVYGKIASPSTVA